MASPFDSGWGRVYFSLQQEKMSEKEIFFNLLRDLIQVYENKSIKDLILTLGVNMEYIVNELLKLKLKKFNFQKINSVSLKLKILKATGNIEDSEYEVCKGVMNIRNEYAHQLEPKTDKILKLISELPINTFNIPGKK